MGWDENRVKKLFLNRVPKRIDMKVDEEGWRWNIKF